MSEAVLSHNSSDSIYDYLNALPNISICQQHIPLNVKNCTHTCDKRFRRQQLRSLYPKRLDELYDLTIISLLIIYGNKIRIY